MSSNPGRLKIMLALLVLVAVLIALYYSSLSTYSRKQPVPSPILKPAEPVKPPPLFPPVPAAVLAAPSQWIDPLDQVGAESPVLAHAEELAILPDADEEKTFADMKSRFDWLTNRSSSEPDYRTRAAALRQMAVEAVQKWPQSKHLADVRYYALRAAESFSPEPPLAEEFWAYATTKAAAQRGATPQSIGVREVSRVTKGLPKFALLYGKILIEKAPATSEAYWASFYMAKNYQFDLNDTEAARKAYLYTAESKDAYIRVMGRWWALKQGMQFLNYKTIAEDGPLLLKEETVKNEDRPWISLTTAQAFLKLNRDDEALQLARSIQKDFPETPQAQDAKKLEDQVVKKVFSGQAKP